MGARELQGRRGSRVSAETVRRGLPEWDWGWKRAQLSAKDADPQRVAKLARMRYGFESLRGGTALLFADELDLALLPKVGSQGRPKGEQVEVLPPATNEQRSLAGARDITTGTPQHGVWYRKTTGLVLALLQRLDRAYPATSFRRLSSGVDNSKSHKATEVEKWLAGHPRIELLYLPTYCPRANPLERAFGDVLDKCTRNPQRQRIWTLVADGEQHLVVNGPWPYLLSDIDYPPEVTAAVQALLAPQPTQEEISQLAA
jgi:hypothetical protein